MQITATHSANTTTLQLVGKFDIDAVPAVETALQSSRSIRLQLNLKDCTYISSAGLRVLLATQKSLSSENRNIELIQVPKPILDILDTTGLRTILPTQPLLRDINLDDCELLAAGVCGQCFRIDEETIVKVYNEGVAPEVAEQEKHYAREAFLLGIPTALSYDVVNCGNRTGIVFEMLNAELFSRIIARNPEQLDDHARKLASIANHIGSIRPSTPAFPDMKQRMRNFLHQAETDLPKTDIDLLLSKLEEIPDDDHCLHFDLHTSNIMIKDNEPLLLDLGDLSTGSYLFDVGVLATIYADPASGICERVTQLPGDFGLRFFKRFCDHLFATKPPADRDFFEKNLNFFRALRPIYNTTFLPHFRKTWIPRLKDEILPLIRAEA